MNYILEPTLRHMCLVKIATQLWSRDDFPVQDGIPTYYYPGDRAAGILEKVQTLSMPNRLKTELSVMIKPMEKDMIIWFYHLFNHYDLVRSNPRELRWTPHGTIDGGKSVEVILTTDRSYNISLDKRIDLARDFCLVNQITSLWKQLLSLKEPNNSISHRCRRFSSIFKVFAGDLPQQVPSGMLVPAGESMTFPLKYEFISAMYNNNAVAAKYFFAKLSPEEVNEWVASDYDRGEFNSLYPFGTDLLCFILSRLDQNQRSVVLTGRRSSFDLEVSYNMLSRFLEWPYQGFFLDAVQPLWDYVSETDFEILLYRISVRISKGFEHCTYRNILREFWQSSPMNLKKRVINNYYGNSIGTGRRVLYFLFKHGEEDMCRLVLKEANAAEKERLVAGVEEARHHLQINKTEVRESCAFLKCLLVECDATEEKIDQFKAYFASPADVEMNDEERKSILQFLENFSSK